MIGEHWGESELSWGDMSGNESDLNGVISTPEGILEQSALMVVRPDLINERVSAALFAPEELTWLLYRLNPFSSRAGLPDIVLFDDDGGRLLGYYGMSWEWRSEWTLYTPDSD